MDEKTIRKRIVSIITQHIPDAKIILFGSRARGDYTEHSDYDIAIISNLLTDKNTIYSKINKQIHEVVDAPFDIVLFTQQEYEDGKNGLLPELIEQEGVQLSVS